MKIRDLIDSGKISLDTVVLGELQRTKDGAIVGNGADIYCNLCEPGEALRSWHNVASPIGGDDTVQADDMVDIDECYSTREAAERAAQEGR